MFANVVLRKFFGHRAKYQKVGDNCTARSGIICALGLMLLRTNESWRVKCRDMWHTWERRETQHRTLISNPETENLRRLGY
jgi:hypothetical protein